MAYTNLLSRDQARQHILDADPGVVLDRIRCETGARGFDAARYIYVEMIDARIIDPTKVVRIPLENAVSVAGILLLAEATLI